MGGYGSSTNEARKLRKLEGQIRRAVTRTIMGGQEAMLSRLITHCQEYPGAVGMYSMTNSAMRDILKTLAELDEMREGQ